MEKEYFEPMHLDWALTSVSNPNMTLGLRAIQVISES
jgi:hypothetical protein